MRITEFRSIINEGGNIFKDSDGNILTTRINRADIIPTIKWLEQITNLPLLTNTLGSVGKKESSGDLDIAVDQNVISKEDLINKLTSWAKANNVNPKDYIKKSGISVHFKTPIDGDPKNGWVQTDLMFGDDINHMKFGLFSAGDKTKFSGADRNLLLSSIAKSLPDDLKYSWQKGLINRSTGESITKNPDLIAQILLGNKKYNKDDLDSVESIMAAIKQNPARFQMLADLSNKLSDQTGKTPADIHANSEESSRIKNILDATKDLNENFIFDKIKKWQNDRNQNRVIGVGNDVDMSTYSNMKRAIASNGFNIRFVSHPDIELQELAVTNKPLAIADIKHPDKKIQMLAVKLQPYVIRLIKNPSEDVQLLAVNEDYESIRGIKRPTEAVMRVAVHNCLPLIFNRYAKISNKIANEFKSEIIKYMLNMFKIGHIDQVESYLNGLMQRNINWPELEIMKRSLAAETNRLDNTQLNENIFYDVVKKLKLAKSKIDEPNLENEYNKVKQDGYYIQHIKNPSETLQLLAIEEDPSIIAFIRKPTLLAVKTALIANPMLLQQPDKFYFSNKIVNDCKNEIIKYMLTHIKSTKKSKYYNIHESKLKLIDALQKRGINWPELTIIQHSLIADSNKSTNKQLNEDEIYDKILSSSPEKYKEKLVLANPAMIQRIIDPSEKLQMIAIEEHYSNIQFIKNPTEKVQLTAIDYNPRAIRSISNPCDAAIIKALNDDFYLIQYIDNLNDHIKLIIKNIADDKKQDIVKHLLIEIKTNPKLNWLDARNIIIAMKNCGVNWPEFNIFEKSLSALAKDYF